MQLLVRLVLIIAGGIAAWFVTPDSPNFQVVQGLIGVAVIAAMVAVLVLARRK